MLIEVSESTQAAEARRKAVSFAEDLHFAETRRGAVALATTEIATNLIKHAGSGHILLQQLPSNGAGLRIIGVDRGPGIVNVSGALADGHSTSGTMGAGLGAIRRVSDAFDLYSIVGSGTVISAEFREPQRSPLSQDFAMEVGVVSEPIQSEEVCGDGWGVRYLPAEIVLMVADGLGHGVMAAEAAREAERVFSTTEDSSPVAIIREAHAALKKTRGAALGVAKVEKNGLLSFAGVGNITATIVSPGGSRSMTSHNGIVGQQMERLQEFTCPWNRDSIVVMHSDGLTSRWDLERYPGIWSKGPSLIAAVLHRDFCRNRDDVTVLVAKAATN